MIRQEEDGNWDNNAILFNLQIKNNSPVMKIKFDAYEIAHSPLHEAGKNYSRPAVVNPQTIPTCDIITKAINESTLTAVDLSAALTALTHNLQLQLLQGNAVHLDGIGTFSLSLKFEDATKPTADITARDVRVGGVNFIPDHTLLATLQDDAKFERFTAIRSSQASEEDALIALREYFQSHQSITKRAFQELLGLKYGRATKLLLSLEAKDMIVISRVGQTNFYYPGSAL